MLNILEPFELRSMGYRVHRGLPRDIEAMRRGFLDRARYLGDQDFVDRPGVSRPPNLRRRLWAGKSIGERASSSEQLAPDIPSVHEGGQHDAFLGRGR